jgi:hypothetical protein
VAAGALSASCAAGVDDVLIVTGVGGEDDEQQGHERKDDEAIEV